MIAGVDDKDLKILDILKSRGDYTTRQISKATGFPATTIHNRIVRMKKEGIIKNYTINLNHKQVGKNFAAIILVSVDYKNLREQKKDQHILAQELGKMPEVEEVTIVTGGIDMVLKVRVTDVEAYDQFLFKKLQKISGIGNTQSLVIINEAK